MGKSQAEKAKMVSVIIMILGLIGSFWLANKLGVTYDTSGYFIEEERNWLLTIVIFVAGTFSTFLTSYIYRLFAEVLEYLDFVRSDLYDIKDGMNK